MQRGEINKESKRNYKMKNENDDLELHFWSKKNFVILFSHYCHANLSVVMPTGLPIENGNLSACANTDRWPSIRLTATVHFVIMSYVGVCKLKKSNTKIFPTNPRKKWWWKPTQQYDFAAPKRPTEYGSTQVKLDLWAPNKHFSHRSTLKDTFRLPIFFWLFHSLTILAVNRRTPITS